MSAGPSEFPARFRRARLDAGLTQQQLADQAGCDLSTIARFERPQTRAPTTRSRFLPVIERIVGVHLVGPSAGLPVQGRDLDGASVRELAHALVRGLSAARTRDDRAAEVRRAAAVGLERVLTGEITDDQERTSVLRAALDALSDPPDTAAVFDIVDP